MTSGTDELHIFYDAQNRPAVVVYNGTAYAYVKSLQGDIVAILDENGNTVVSYGYDAWGAPLWCTGELAETLGKVQPFRYRGYVFDEETGLYYLRSRYYNPGWGRFVNADNSILPDVKRKSNLFAYCSNSPVLRIDQTGHADMPKFQEGTPEYELALLLMSSFETRHESVVDKIQSSRFGFFKIKHSITTGYSNKMGQRENGVFAVAGVSTNEKDLSDSTYIVGVAAYGEYTDIILGFTVSDGAISIEVGYGNQSVGLTLGLSWGLWGPYIDISLEHTVYNDDGSYMKQSYTASVSLLFAVATVAAIAVIPTAVAAASSNVPALIEAAGSVFAVFNGQASFT